MRRQLLRRSAVRPASQVDGRQTKLLRFRRRAICGAKQKWTVWQRDDQVRGTSICAGRIGVGWLGPRAGVRQVPEPLLLLGLREWAEDASSTCSIPDAALQHQQCRDRRRRRLAGRYRHRQSLIEPAENKSFGRLSSFKCRAAEPLNDRSFQVGLDPLRAETRREIFDIVRRTGGDRRNFVLGCRTCG